MKTSKKLGKRYRIFKLHKACEDTVVRQVSQNKGRIRFQVLHYIAICLVFASTAFGDSWFVAPSASVVFPSKSNIVYHGMIGKVDYRAGYGEGLSIGRSIGNFKLYISYDHASFKARSLTLQTPFGKVSQSDSDNQDIHTVLLNADYVSNRSYFGFKPYAGAGLGASIDSSTNTCAEGRIGLSRALPWGFTATVGYSYRWTDGQQRFGKKSDGSYSIVIDEPSKQRLTLSVSRSF